MCENAQERIDRYISNSSDETKEMSDVDIVENALNAKAIDAFSNIAIVDAREYPAEQWFEIRGDDWSSLPAEVIWADNAYHGPIIRVWKVCDGEFEGQLFAAGGNVVGDPEVFEYIGAAQHPHRYVAMVQDYFPDRWEKIKAEKPEGGDWTYMIVTSPEWEEGYKGAWVKLIPGSRETGGEGTKKMYVSASGERYVWERSFWQGSPDYTLTPEADYNAQYQ